MEVSQGSDHGSSFFEGLPSVLASTVSATAGGLLSESPVASAGGSDLDLSGDACCTCCAVAPSSDSADASAFPSVADLSLAFSLRSFRPFFGRCLSGLGRLATSISITTGSSDVNETDFFVGLAGVLVGLVPSALVGLGGLFVPVSASAAVVVFLASRLDFRPGLLALLEALRPLRVLRAGGVVLLPSSSSPAAIVPSTWKMRGRRRETDEGRTN